jgi:two-component system sensor histidine kinase CiaH
MKMIKKFRNKVLVLNMTITSAVVLSAFSVIYFITYSNVSSEIENNLDQAPGVSSELNRAGIVAAEAVGSSSQSYLMFSILVDAQGNVLAKASGLNFEPGFYEQAVAIALDNPNSKADITLGGRQWRYAVTPIIDARLNGTRQVIGNIDTADADKFSIVFLDVTAYNETLYDLMTTLLLVGSVTLLAIFLVSLYFANRAIKPLADAWQKQKQFVADASHELKTPLSIIIANYDALLANREETIQSQIKWVDYIRIGTDRMSKLINNLLTLARFDDTELVTQFNLSETVQSVILSMEAPITEKGIELSVSIEPDIFIESDAEGLKQVVTILLDNAIKYTEQNGQIDVALTRSNHQAEFSIKNSGKGIPKQEIPKIFDRFYRADHSRTHESGSYGLGLSIAKAVMDMLGGNIQVQSVEGEYTTFTFRLNLR